MITFTIPGPPVPKERARRARNGRWYTPTRTRDYESLVGSCGRHAGCRARLGPVRMTVAVYWPDNRRRDLDNAVKSIADGLNGIAYEDDAQITGWNITAHLDRLNPRAVVTVEYANDL